jgi:hypothetical protein
VYQEGGRKVKNKLGNNTRIMGISDGEKNNPRTMAKHSGEEQPASGDKYNEYAFVLTRSADLEKRSRN